MRFATVSVDRQRRAFGQDVAFFNVTAILARLLLKYIDALIR